MRRWHQDVSFMERQRKMDLRDHRQSALRRGLGPDDFECICKVSRGKFRKHKQWACSCYGCRAESAYGRIRQRSFRHYMNVLLRTGRWDELVRSRIPS